MGELALATVTTATFKKVSLKLLAEVLIDFCEGKCTVAKIIEVLIDNLPLLVFLETLLAEVFQKVDAELLFIEEAELLVEQLLKRRQRIASAFSIMEALNSRSRALAECP